MAEGLAVQTRQEGDVGIVVTDGYINNIGAEKVAEACNTMVDDGVTRILLNLEQSRIINSIGISILIEVIEKVKGLNGKVGFCCVTPTIGKTFRIMGLLKASTIYESEAEAIAGLSD